MSSIRLLLLWLLALSASATAAEPSRVLLDRLMHLRIDGPREWIEFADTADGSHWEIKFEAAANQAEQSLRLRQQDVKQSWRVLLNDRELGRLRVDENDMLVHFAIPPRALVDGPNRLRIDQDERRGKTLDDIRIGSVILDTRSLSSVLSEATVEIDVVDADSREHLPARITVVDRHGTLQTVGAVSNDHLAVRVGIVYTASGVARFGLPAGEYTIHAGRGFEYSLDSTTLTVAAGETQRKTLAIRREVPTGGYVACDTHVHTLTHSGHGDATVDERMITLAGEGIELAIATDHNVHVDHDPIARRMNVRRYFTPVIGNEVTTSVGHFNIFPVTAGAPIPNDKLDNWEAIFSDIYRTPGVKIAILNHARDLHGGTRPFGPKLHNAVVGENVAGWPLRANAMEVVNSGATQSDILQLFHDWMGMLNRGKILTPVGASDSHDVGRHFVGQGRTYIRADDRDPGAINVDEAVNNFVQGRVMVSYGLLAELTVNGKYGPGELAAVPGDSVDVAVRVLGPHWVRARTVQLYANGQKIREEDIATHPPDVKTPGVKWSGSWQIAKPKHDVHLVAIAIGDGIDGVYWKTAKPYLPMSPDWEPKTIGCSGAVWLDVDGDGRRTAAFDYAQQLLATSQNDLTRLIDLLRDYDASVAAQAAHQWQRAVTGRSLLSADAQAALKQAAPSTRVGVQLFLDAWRENMTARSIP